MAQVKLDDAIKHIDEHVMYPASKDDIVKACNDMADVPEGEKQWVNDKLPAKTYNTSDEVREALEQLGHPA